MREYRVMNEIDAIVSDAKTAVLATVDSGGMPRLRWITPGIVPERPGALYIVTAHHFSKVEQVQQNPGASMLLQTRSLNRILSLQGTVTVLENLSIRAEVLERIGGRLHAFWRMEAPDRELVVLEFTIHEAVLYLPQMGVREVLSLTEEVL